MKGQMVDAAVFADQESWNKLVATLKWIVETIRAA